MGITSRIQTDGKQTWLLLNLTRNDDSHLRLMLPEWTVPLAVKYTQHRTQFHSAEPQPVAVTVSQALDDAGVHGLVDPPAKKKSKRS